VVSCTVRLLHTRKQPPVSVGQEAAWGPNIAGKRRRRDDLEHMLRMKSQSATWLAAPTHKPRASVHFEFSPPYLLNGRSKQLKKQCRVNYYCCCYDWDNASVSAVNNRPFVHPPDDTEEYGAAVEWYWQGKTEGLWKNHKSHTDCPRRELGSL
jgi:hypothetical protein